MSNIILMVETGADLLPEIKNRYNIQTVPMHVLFGDTSFDDGTFPIEKLYQYYEETHLLPTTSGCMPLDFMRAFDRVHELYPDKHILHLAYSAATTCSYQSAGIAAKGRDYVTSLDTKNLSVGQMAIVAQVAQLLERKPDILLEEVLLFAQTYIDSARMMFIPGDLAYLRAGGRVSNAAYIGAQILHLFPLIEVINGCLLSTKKYRGRKARVIEKVVHDYLSKRNPSKEHIWMFYSVGLEEGLKR
ncbi:MAG: DegV family protein, partial [Clostridiales bacterium]